MFKHLARLRQSAATLSNVVIIHQHVGGARAGLIVSLPIVSEYPFREMLCTHLSSICSEGGESIRTWRPSQPLPRVRVIE